MVASVDGLVSGLNTSSLIEQLMQLEARPQTLLRTKVSAAQKFVAALQSVNSRMASVRTLGEGLAKASTWRQVSATSSSDAVTATAGPNAKTGTLTFDVTALAAAQVHGTTDAYQLTDTVAGTSLSFTNTKTGATTTVNLANSTLQGVVDAVNASNAGVKASAVQNAATGNYRLLLTAATTGTASDFTVTGLTVAEGVVKAGADAALQVGTLTVTSSSNTFQDVMPGVTFVANRVQAGVTVDVKTDTASLASKAGELVKAMNGALEEIDRLASYNAATKQGGALLADGAVARLRNSLLAAVSTGAADGTSFAEVGITLTREGRVAFDEPKFKAAMAKDPAKVEAMFDTAVTAAGRSSTAAGSLTLVSTSPNTALGTHAVNVTQAATQASADASFTGVNAGATYRMVINVVNVDVVAPDTTVAGLASKFQTEATARGMRVTVGVNPANTGQIVATMQDYGSAHSVDFVKLGDLNTTNLGMLDGAVTAGLNVAGTIGGLTASGAGNRLSTVGVAGAATDIVVDVTPVATGGVGSVTVAAVAASSGGLASRLAAIGKAASDAAVGTLTTLISSREAAVKGLNDRIADWDVRLTRRRLSLQRQFASLETALSRLKDQGGWLAGQIASLPRT